MPEQAPNPEWLNAMFGLPPKDAVAFLREKGLAVSWDWQEMLDEAHARAFTVAKAAQLDVLCDIRSGLLDALKEGKTFQQFRKELEPLLIKRGWWGKQNIVGPDQKEHTVQLGSPHRLKTIYQTNLQSAYMAGRMKAQMEASIIEYLQYVAIMDRRTRPTHAALNGRVWPKDDPIWSSIYPPNGFRCRCRVVGMTAAEAQSDGAQIEDSEGQIETRTVNVGASSLSGELFPTTQTGVRVTLPNGTRDIMWTDPGFNSSPIACHIFDNYLGKKAVDALQDGPLAFKKVQDTVLSQTRMKAWLYFLENSKKYGQPQGKTMTVGVLPFHVATETGFAPILNVNDRLVMGGKAIRHGAAKDGLSLQDWRDLPNKLPHAEWYTDTHSGNVVAVMEGNTLSAVFSKEGKMDTVYRDTHIERKIREKLWVRLDHAQS